MPRRIVTISLICVFLCTAGHPVARQDIAVRPPDPNTILFGQTKTFMVHGIAPRASVSPIRVLLVTATHKETGAMHILAYAGAAERLPLRAIRYRHSIITGVMLRGEFLFIASITGESRSRTPPWSRRHQQRQYATGIEVIAISDLQPLGSRSVPVTPTPDDRMSALKGGVLTAFGTGVRLDDWRIDIDADGKIVMEQIKNANDP